MTSVDFIWLIGGPQGSGVESGANIFSRVCAEIGYQVYGKREFYSNIKGEHSYFAVRISDKKIHSNVNDVTLMASFDVETCMIDVTKKHEGKTKHSRISYVTDQTGEFLIGFMDSRDYDSDNDDYDNQKIFSISDRTIQQKFKDVSDMMNVKINTHLLRKVFAEKCTSASMHEKYIDAFCGRVPKSVLRKNYSEYSPKKMREQYEKIHDSLVFDGL